MTGELDVKRLRGHERTVVALALGYAIAAIDGIEKIAPPFAPLEEKEAMKALLEAMIPDDAELEELLRSASWRVGHLVGQWPPQGD